MNQLPYVPVKDWTEVDRRVGLPDDDQIRAIADRWNSQKTQNQHRPEIVADHRLVGLLGERAFARMFRLPMDLADKRHGSRRANFRLSNGWIVDVVTRRPIHGVRHPELAVPEDTRGTADVWVLCVWLGEQYEPHVAGWIPEPEGRRRGRIQQFHEKGVPNVVVGRGWLAPMSGLLWYHRASHPDAVEIPLSWWDERAAERELLDEIAPPPSKTKKRPPQDDEGPTVDQLKLL